MNKKEIARKMKHNPHISVAGTGLVGSTGRDYKTVAKAFGRHSKGDKYKTDAEWHLQTPEGPATVYNYKTGKSYLGKEGVGVKKERDWHIGGKKKAVVPYVKSVLRHYSKHK